MDKNNVDQAADDNLEGNSLVEKLRAQRTDGSNTDLNISVGGKLFKCHRSTLSTASPFFESKLKSSKSKNEIEIDWDDVNTFESVLDYIYTGQIELTPENFDKVIELSHLLSINKLKGHCESKIEPFICLDNCLRLKEMCENYKLEKASEHCLKFIYNNLLNVLAHDDFLQLSAKNVELFFIDPETGCDNTPLETLLEVLSNWTRRDVEERVMDYQKLLSILDWSNCSDEIFDHLKEHELFEESKLCLYFVLHTMETNGLDLKHYRSEYAELKKSFENDDGKGGRKETARSTRSSRRQAAAAAAAASTATNNHDDQPDDVTEPAEADKRQGKRTIKRKFDSQEWVTSNNATTAKKKKGNSISAQQSVLYKAMDNETDRAVYMIKVNSAGENKTTSVEKVINEVSLVATNEKPNNRATSSKSTSSNNQITVLQVVDAANDSNAEFDESEYDVEVSTDGKDMLSMKTEYCVRGKKHSATLAQWKEGVKCPKCTYIGHSAPRLEQHLAKVHQEDTTYQCKYCNFTCKWNREYYKHMKVSRLIV